MPICQHTSDEDPWNTNNPHWVCTALSILEMLELPRKGIIPPHSAIQSGPFTWNGFPFMGVATFPLSHPARRDNDIFISSMPAGNCLGFSDHLPMLDGIRTSISSRNRPPLQFLQHQAPHVFDINDNPFSSRRLIGGALYQPVSRTN